MNIKPFPGYENHMLSYTVGDNEELQKRRQAQGQALMAYELPEGMKMEDKVIPGGDGQDMNIRVYIPKDLPANSPMVLDIHGGAFVGGNLDIDNARCIALATRVPAVVVGVEYRLCTPGGGAVHFPAPLMDCRAAYLWMKDHAAELGADGSRIGIHGSSSGGNLSAGLALYLRDHNEQAPSLTILNCATYTSAIEETMSYQQLYQYKMGPDNKAMGAEAAYLGGYDGTAPSYYAFPALCHDLGGLGAHFIIAGEYDTLRDSAIAYAAKLLRNAVPTELFVAGRLGHCFSCAPHPYTDLTHDLIAASLQREFGLLDHLKKEV